MTNNIRRVWTTRDFWLDVFERTVGTAIQVALGILGAGVLAGVSMPAVLITIGLATLLAFLKALAAGFKGDSDISPASLVPSKVSSDVQIEEIV